ncbi:carboxypeptidase-like regulatory domain-containing protein [Flavobacterium sp. 3HN19-14]|uniref:carboxypeptidase-like regulatory domain-containing protein n=1 Tax=Flavobacterium sp. 3HN19-14 TaxID=3448133 RepID=UPI003EDECAE1
MKFKFFISILLLPFFVPAQTSVKGIVAEEEGKPIPYVNIWIENENAGTTADADGVFSININDVNKVLVFSAVGFENKKIAAANAEKVVLKRAITLLDEVVVRKPKGIKQVEIDTYKKSDIHFYYGCWQLAVDAGQVFCIQ